MGFKVKVRNVDRTIDVDAGESILEAAILAGIDYPCGCQSGNCGACKSELVSGEVEMSPYSDFALLDEERDQGLVLACRAVPWSDCEIGWLEPDEVVAHARRILTCRVTKLIDETHDVRRVQLAIEDGGPFDFSAGQYATVTFGDLPARDFSMANRPGTEPLEFHIRHIDGGMVSRYVAETLKVGDAVRVEGPFGISYLRETHNGPIVAVAGSTGLAPVLSIVETALCKGLRQPILTYFGVRDERDLYLVDHLEKLAALHNNLRLETVLSEPSNATDRRTGLISDAIASDFSRTNALDGAKAYVAGPPAMVEATMEVLQSRGMRRQDCHADAFYTEAEKAAVEAAT